MYMIKTAAKMLDVSEKTVRRWIKEDNINPEVIYLDRNCMYLSYNDILTLAKKHRPLKIKTESKQNYPDITGLYSIDDVARMFGVTKRTIEKWVKNTKIETSLITTDKKRAYVSYSGLVLLANTYNRIIPYEPGMPQSDNVTQDAGPSEETKLYTIAEAALFLGVSEMTIRRWLSRYNIAKQTVATDKKHVYIAYSDVMMLAARHSPETTYPITLISDIRETQNRLAKIEADILNLQKRIKESNYLDQSKMRKGGGKRR